MRTNYVLIDFENVQPMNLDLLKGGPFTIKVFLGAKQTKIPLEVASALQAFGTAAEYIQIEGSGHNALDFCMAYYIGRLASETPDAYFHIISKDTGFDPLIKHLKTQEIYCKRSAAIGDIPLLKAKEPIIEKTKPIIETEKAKSITEKVEAVIGNLVKRKVAKPRTIKTLGSSIKALFVNALSDQELNDLIAHLVERGVVNISGDKVSYALPPESP